MPRDPVFQNGDLVVDGRGNKGQVFKFWNERSRSAYFRVRLIDGTLRQAGRMWVSTIGWRHEESWPSNDRNSLRCADDGEGYIGSDAWKTEHHSRESRRFDARPAPLTAEQIAAGRRQRQKDDEENPF